MPHLVTTFLNEMGLEPGCWEVIVLQAEEKIQDPRIQ